MALHATESIEDAYEATRSLLLPFDAAQWLRLALVVLFVGGFGTTFNYASDLGGPGGDAGAFPGGVDIPLGHALGSVGGAVVVALALLAFVVALVVLFVGSVMEFVLVETLRDAEVRVRDRFADNLGNGAQLFGFRLVLVLVVLVLVGGAFALGLALQGPGVRFLPVLLAAPVVLVVGPVVAVVHGFTTVFVVPTMLRTGGGVVAGWRRLWDPLRGHLDEFGVYLVLSVVMGFVGAALVAAVTGVVAAIVLLPVGILGGGLVLGLLGATPLALLFILPLFVVAVVVLAAITAVVRVPVVTFLRYYALFVLGGVDRDLDLVADFRGGEGDEPTTDAGDDEVATNGTDDGETAG